MSLDESMDRLTVTVLNCKAERDEFQRRLTEILEVIDGREDIEDTDDGRGSPNVFMRIGMIAKGEDNP